MSGTNGKRKENWVQLLRIAHGHLPFLSYPWSFSFIQYTQSFSPSSRIQLLFSFAQNKVFFSPFGHMLFLHFIHHLFFPFLQYWRSFSPWSSVVVLFPLQHSLLHSSISLTSSPRTRSLPHPFTPSSSSWGCCKTSGQYKEEIQGRGSVGEYTNPCRISHFILYFD